VVEQKAGFSWITMEEDTSSTVCKTMMIEVPHSDSPNVHDQQKKEQVKNTNSYKVIITEETP